jgi:hypothetical protein
MKIKIGYPKNFIQKMIRGSVLSVGKSYARTL